jgi:phenylacetate-CoA ligase
MAFSDKIYSLLPLPLQNVAISIFGFLWQKRRFGGIFKAKLIEFKSREKYTELEWKEYQTKELRSILKSAFQFVPFYNKKYSQAGFKLSDFDNFELDDLKRLPFLEKDELRVHGKTSLLSNKLDPHGSFFSSSGSTSKPVSVYLSKKTLSILVRLNVKLL